MDATAAAAPTAPTTPATSSRAARAAGAEDTAPGGAEAGGGFVAELRRLSMKPEKNGQPAHAAPRSEPPTGDPVAPSPSDAAPSPGAFQAAAPARDGGAAPSSDTTAQQPPTEAALAAIPVVAAPPPSDAAAPQSPPSGATVAAPGAAPLPVPPRMAQSAARTPPGAEAPLGDAAGMSAAASTQDGPAPTPATTPPGSGPAGMAGTLPLSLAAAGNSTTTAGSDAATTPRAAPHRTDAALFARHGADPDAPTTDAATDMPTAPMRPNLPRAAFDTPLDTAPPRGAVEALSAERVPLASPALPVTLEAAAAQNVVGQAAPATTLPGVEAPPAIPAPRPPPPPPVRQVAPIAIALALGAGGAPRLTVALEPEELGRVEIRVERGGAEGDAAMVRVVAERPETLALLQRDARQLDRALQGVGIALAEGGMQFSLAGRDERAAGDPGAKNNDGGRAARRDRAAQPDAALLQPAPRPRAAAGLSLLDIAI